MIFALLFALSGCTGSGDKKNTSWTLKYSRTGGYPDYKDRLEITGDGNAVYYDDNAPLLEYEVDEGTAYQAQWLIDRNDIVTEVGTYKSGGKKQDDVTFLLVVIKKDKTYKIEWDSRSKHPAVLDEIRPVLDQFINMASEQAAK